MNPDSLIGFNALFARAQQCIAHDRLPHALMIAGQKGSGKGLFARALTTQLTGPAPHPDVLLIEPLQNEKSREAAREITVDQIREIGAFLGKTPMLALRKIVLLDSADLLNIAASNALLKLLEDPPAHSMLILIAHQPAQLLPTIRSRVSIWRAPPRSYTEFTTILQRLEPDLTYAQIDLLWALCPGSPGMAAELYQQNKDGSGIETIYESFLNAFTMQEHQGRQAVIDFADSVTRAPAASAASGQTHTRWRLLEQLGLCAISRTAKFAAGISHGTALSSHEHALMQHAADTQSPTHWAQAWSSSAHAFTLARTQHLDYSNALQLILRQG